MLGLKKGIYIVGACRTAFGKFGGSLKGITPTDLAVHASKAAIAAAKLTPDQIDSVVVGNVIPSSPDALYIGRHVGLKTGVSLEKPMLSVNRQCGSGFQSVINAVQEILLGDSNIVLTAGTENMSMTPFAVYDVRFGTKFGQQYKFTDLLFAGLNDSYVNMPMAITAEKLGKQYEITREMCDEFAFTSLQRYINAQNNGIYDSEICPIPLKVKGKEKYFTIDEHPRYDATFEMIQKLPSVFVKDGLVSAANASGINDGSGAVIIASEEACSKHNLKPLARIVGYGIAGCDPTIMGIGPAFAIRKALTASNLRLDDMDMVEVNEAFAAQYLAVEKELGLDRAKSNINGGGISIGHPLAASGSRITAHIAHQLNNTSKKYGVGSACIGGGQGIAIILQKV